VGRRFWRALFVVYLVVALLYAPEPEGEPLPPLRPIPIPTVSVRLLEVVRLGRVTYYNAVPEQTDSDPLTSACGPNLERQVALSRDLFRTHYDCGTMVRVWIEDGYLGEFTVWDTMHPRFENTLDILADGVQSWGRSHGHLVVVD